MGQASDLSTLWLWFFTFLGYILWLLYRGQDKPLMQRLVQHLEHTSRKEIHFGGPQNLCLDVRREQVILQNCTAEGPAIHQQQWDFQENGMIVHILSGKCMEAVVQENNKDLYLRQCDGKASQLWRFDNVSAVDER
uniref:Polypeptide N-acetylgalactosaminyltransferase 15 n=1 Tax=Pipistrellus kuhlii TaxID=59472 RepID=A0A7J7WCT7_PIPKU|nr:polypeptide N-acetylgalactosaminyltransferase 15 [Pipistrellus kuhlii]